ncbi:hypothetical protein FSP39_024352 [Pinctada imbricata]|uniref:CDC20/Fizzy WD40 domain-containing protein n=1 Tax=Pinctada imbricata TaxID=66713 RepID=A0AA88XU88_PINIB|nr:hypothetical protein FSP39_024352 [Pinctada imbricata]
MTGSNTTYAICGNIRRMGESDDSLIRLSKRDNIIAKIMSPVECTSETQPRQNRDIHSVLYNKFLDGALNTPKSQRILPLVNSNNDSGYNSPDCSPSKSPLCTGGIQSVFDSPKKCHSRPVQKFPKVVFDVPALRDDFYTNVFHWGASNKIAIALDKAAYTWNADTRACSRLELPYQERGNVYISSLCWDSEGETLAIANNKGTVSMCTEDRVLKDIELRKKATICVMKWEGNILYSGTDQGEIYFYDTRCQHIQLRVSVGHRDMCGMQLLTGSPYMATGSDDGCVLIWDNRSRECVREIDAHTGCSKALAWCPWRSSFLATGGGACDRYIRIWQVHTGEKVAEVYTKAQVCGLLWSEAYHELASSLASTPEYTINDIVLWRMNSLTFEPQAILQRHLDRPLHMDLSPDKTTIGTCFIFMPDAGADEALCLWDCFPSQRRESVDSRDVSPLCLDRSIR